MEFRAFGDFGQYIDEHVTAQIVLQAKNIMDWLIPLANNVLIIYMALWGIAHLLGKIDEMLVDGVVRFMKIVVVIAIALNITVYAPVVIAFFYNGGSEIAGAIVGSGGYDTLGFLDTTMQKAFVYGNTAWDMGSVWDGDFAFYVIALVIWGSGLAFTIFAAGMVLLSKIAISLLLGIGPIFIILSLFEQTKKFLESWMQLLMNYFMLLVLVSAAVNLVFGIMSHMLDQLIAVNEPQILNVLQFVALSGLIFVVFLQLPRIASTLGGGVELATIPAWRGAKRALLATGRNARPTTWSKRGAALSTEFRAVSHQTKRVIPAFRRANSIQTQ